MRKTHLVIGDSHAKPGVNNNRFIWAGRLAVDIRADVIIDIGDWWDMESLSSYDKGKKSFEGRRYKADIDAGIDAMDKLCGEIAKENGYNPKLIRTKGNHEERILKAVNNSPELEGVIGHHDLKSDEYGFKEYEYMIPVVTDGIAACHIYASGIMGRPISGENPAASVLAKKAMSCVFGHSHVLDFATRNNAMGKRMSAVNVGCFFEHDESYAGRQVNRMWDRGLTVLNEVQAGEFDFQWISMAAIKKRYS